MDIKRIILLVICITYLSWVPASAYDFDVDGIEYKILSSTELTCEVNGYRGSATFVTIPSHVNFNNKTLTVISIGDFAFTYKEGITSITLPNSIVRIGTWAFLQCKGLSSIVIPNSVTTIESQAFADCTGLTSINLGNSIKNIESNVFQDCTGLTSIIIPNSVTSIGQNAFHGCTSLRSIIIPNNVTSIGYQAFYGCSGIKSITIPNSVTSIGEYAFGGCHPQVCIFGCKASLVNRDFGGGNVGISKDSIVKIILMEEVTDFSGYNFSNALKLDSLVSMALTPPIIANVSESQKAKTKVLIPQGTSLIYQSTDVWRDFWNIKETNIESSIANVRNNRNIKISYDGNTLIISGFEDISTIGVYSFNGTQLGSTKSKNGFASFNIDKTNNNVIVKVSNESIKVNLK